MDFGGTGAECYGLNCVFTNSYVEGLNPQCGREILSGIGLY